MLLLISTPLHIFLLDPVTRRITFLRSGDGYYYGFTNRQGQVAITHTGGYLQVFSPQGRPHRSISNLVQPHQAEWVDDKILVANTGRNCLSVYDSLARFERDVYLNDIRTDDKQHSRLANHFNSVHRLGDKVYVVAHNYDRPSEVWILSWPSLQVLETKTTTAGWAHNVWPSEQGLLICNSKNGALHEALTSRTLWRSDQQPVMTRGLAVSQDHIFVGRSLHNPRLERFWKDGGLWILDRHTFQTLDRIDLPAVGDVHEVRLVGLPDEAHNGELLSLEDLPPLKSLSPVVQLAYLIRRSSPALRRNFFPMSQFVRFAQVVRRWGAAKFLRPEQSDV